MTNEERQALLNQLSADAFLLEPRVFFDLALVGVTNAPKDHWPRKGGLTVAVYDRDKCIEAIMSWLDCDYDNALDYYGYNTEGAWLGEGTPTFTGSDLEDED